VQETALHQVPKVVRKNKYSSLKQVIQQYGSAIIKLLTYMPIGLLAELRFKDPIIDSIINKFLELCVEAFPSELEAQASLIQNIIQLSKYKKTLFTPPAQWIKIFSAIIEQDTKNQHWPLYFFLASTKTPSFSSLIPFSRILQSLSLRRHELDLSFSYQPPSKDPKPPLPGSPDPFPTHTLSREWEMDLFKVFSMVLMVREK
jgi:hypothetical protein